jgi:hypothetical protein
MSRRRKTRTRKPAGDIAAFRENLWRTLERNSTGLTAADVLAALKTISDDIYLAGVDDAYVKTDVASSPAIADAWDLTWVTALTIRLRRMQDRRGRAGAPPPGPATISVPSR